MQKNSLKRLLKINRNVRFSYDITGYPNEITISVYSNEWSYEHNQRMYQIIYSSDNDGNNVKNNAVKFKIQIYENKLKLI